MKYRITFVDTNYFAKKVRGLLNILYTAFVAWKFLHKSTFITFNIKQSSVVSEM